MAQSAFPLEQGQTLLRMEQAASYNRWIADRARPYLGQRVLDVGAGIGTFTALLADGRHVTALEPDPRFLPVLRERFERRPDVDVLPIPLEQLTDGARFDTVICFNVLEHIADDGAAMHAFARHLVSGGRALVLVPAHPALYGEADRALGHVRRYRRHELEEKLQGAGLGPVEVRHVNPVGTLGWLVSSRLLRRRDIPQGPLALYDGLVPVLRQLDALRLPFGLSLWAVAVGRS